MWQRLKYVTVPFVLVTGVHVWIAGIDPKYSEVSGVGWFVEWISSRGV